MSTLRGMIARLFYFLLFAVPLVLFPKSSELFEFNKMVLVYASTVLIVAVWLSRCLAVKKFIFRRTVLDIPLVLFLAALGISTLFSIDPRTSLLGYYSRFHGGFLSYLAYSILYWAYISNCGVHETKRAIRVLLISSFLVCLYGILQHFGIDKNIWVQDVQNRVFSTLGQPNWLAAWVVALLPITWALALDTKFKMQSAKLQLKDVQFWVFVFLSALFFSTLLFTKSRSGLLGFIVADIIFWTTTLSIFRKKAVKEFLIFNFSFLILALAIGTPLTSNIPAPETGGTESGEIRKIVWKGASDLWRRYPLLGTGPETFAYSYYETRPLEHNLVSEWDFLYNKAHNEYLNFLATTGGAGFLSYLFLIFAMIYLFSKNLQRGASLKIALAAGWASILVTNFFGFSVVPVALLFFMFPAMVATNDSKLKTENLKQNGQLSISQKFLVLLVLSLMFYVLSLIARYWRADFLYAKGRLNNDAGGYDAARSYLLQALKLSPNEAIFWSELSKSSAGLAEKNPEFGKEAVSESKKAISLSPRNLSLQRNMASIFIRLAGTDPNYLLEAKAVTENAIAYAPTDAKLYYNLGLTAYRLGQTTEALVILDKTIEMKPNYKNARFAKALILIDLGRREEAKEELVYILEKIDPNDNLVGQELEKL